MNPHALIQRRPLPAARRASAAERLGRAVIVDPYSTGAHLAEAFGRRGVQAVAVQGSAPPLGRSERLRPDRYTAIIADGTDTVDAALFLKELDVRHVLAGTESGVPLADRIAYRLGVPGNDPSTSMTRRDKFAMVRALAWAGLPHARTILADSEGGARKAAEELDSWPLVVKPAASAGSDHVVIAHDIAAVREAAAEILGTTDVYGQANKAVIVQRFLTGTQFAVNSVSQHGVHRIVEVWHDRRTDLGDGRLIYDRMDLLPPDDELVPILADYVRACLDALGIVHGPAHSEVMLTARGPVLIETGARLQGGDSVPLMRAATGTSQTDAAVQAALDSPEAHALRARTPYAYAPVTQFFLQAPANGRIDAAAIERLLQIPGVAGFVHPPAPGTAVRRTVDLLSSPATLYLSGDCAQQIDEAHAAVRELEATCMYHT
ncbi:ATP-grasp domain-containing protein [Actinospica sp. MGRD01-02]|uniref:ATP-grasp domain-containing protein n=1 Tax=Actinospica acidithermotolerans TaxID=2828514 RepID=A0A941IHH8_9ACTN|nr:ATP-grasp domain-containing protein [Actinospica acidithermotolerans]MBR7825732.1 ATP-grasp domain-containing protein [Actinospica acidithermotolerans]